MKNSIKGCISCILPCGALDVIRIVHSNGRVEEISGTIKASEVMKAHPKHVLKKPSSPSGEDGDIVPKIVIVPPDAELRRGKIYFLMPAPPTMTSDKNRRGNKSSGSSTRKKRKDLNHHHHHHHMEKNDAVLMAKNTLLVSSDGYLSDILSEKLSTQRDRRRGRVTVWRPHLESISESSPSTDV